MNAKSKGTKSKTKTETRNSSDYVRQHVVVGWWSLVAFITLGIVLEAMHGLKIGWYLGVDAEQRRLMWTLAHTHGTLISIVHLCFAWTASKLIDWKDSLRATASRCLMAAGVLMPLGFLLGGVYAFDNDPGLGILLVPPGAFLFLITAVLTALAARDIKL